MWSYYGSKSKIVSYYPAPTENKIIEPFAGSAQYSLKYWENDIILLDKYEVIIRLWKWLQQCSEKDILRLPRLKKGETTDSYNFDCIEEKWFIGMIITGGATQPKKTPSSWKIDLRPNTQNYKIEQAAKNIYKIKHWKILQGDYTDLLNENATWFIDPPYYIGGKYYVHNKIDYKNLSDWSKNRIGQVIVCENSKADWLPFFPIVEMQGSKYRTTEVMWYKNK